MARRPGVGILRAVPLLIAIFSLGTTMIVSYELAKSETDRETVRLHDEENHVKAQVKAGANQAFETLERIAIWWRMQSHPVALEDWANDAKVFMAKKEGLLTAALVDANGKRGWIVSEHTIGREASITDPQLQSTVEATRKRHLLTLSNFFESEGRPVLWACIPSRTGFMCGEYDATVLVTSILENQTPDQCSVVVTANGGQIIVPRNPGLAARAATVGGTPLLLGGAHWSVALIQTNPNRSVVGMVVTIFGLVISILLYACAAEAQMASERATQLAELNRRLAAENLERQRAEQNIVRLNQDLQHRLDEFQTLLDVLPVGIAVSDSPDCANIWVNRALANMLQVPMGQNISKSGPGAEELPYKNFRDGAELPPEELPMQVAARTGKRILHASMDVVRADGSVLRTLSYAAPLFDEYGKVRGVINACVDVTEHRALESRLQSAEKYRSLALMAGGIAHDFNNLLTVIIGQASAISESLLEDSAAAHSARELTEAANRAARLVAQLMAFTGNLWFESQPLNLSAEIERMKTSLQNMLPAAANITYDLPADLPAFQAGQSEVEQVVINLVSNAAESLGHDRPGEIEIRVTACELSANDIRIMFPEQTLVPGEYVRLEVIDNGCGIPVELASRIFDPFFTTKFVGRGLGLSAVQGIVHAHGGGVRLVSSPNTGTRAEVVFPVNAPRPIKGVRSVDGAEVPAARTRLKAG